MKAALDGVPPAQLPSGVWRNVDTPVADAPPPAPSEPVGEPLAIGRPAQSAAAPPAPLAPARRPIAPAADDGAPLPPAAIPNVGADAPAPRAPRDRNFIEKLLGAT
jgi:hypothetical protein